ncbi:hypothetical protein QLY52_21590, partial [Cronobacter sakazakii]|nr:hypothetical protein [Cronobacter sakazakii]
LNASGMADRVNILLYHPKHQRTCFYSVDSVGNAVTYEDETVLSHGPVRRLLSRPEVLHCQYDEFAETWPQLAALPLYPAFGYYCLAPLAAEGHIFGGERGQAVVAKGRVERECRKLRPGLGEFVILAVQHFGAREQPPHRAVREHRFVFIRHGIADAVDAVKTGTLMFRVIQQNVN